MLPRKIRRAVIEHVAKQRSREDRSAASTAKISALLSEFHTLNAAMPELNARFVATKTPVETEAAVRELASNYAKSAGIFNAIGQELRRIIAIADGAK